MLWSRFALVAAFLSAPFMHSQATPAAPAPGNVRVQCTIQPAPAPSEALSAYVAGDFAKAETLYTAQLAASPASAYAGLVRTQLQADKLPEALASAKAAVAALPNSALAESLLGDVLLRSGQLPQASEAYQQALTFDRCSARAHFGVGRIYSMTGHPAQADSEFSHAHNLSPDPEITAVYLTNLPVDQRAPALRAFVDRHPQLAPDQIRALTTAAALLDQHALCTPAQPIARASLTIDPIFYGGTDVRSWGLKTRFNDAAAPLLELDSSISGIILNRRDAEKAGVHPLTTATPDAPYTAIADHVQIGNLSYQSCPVRVFPDRMLFKPNSLIGLDFFRDHLMRVDYVAKTLILAPYPAQPGADADLGPTPATPTDKAWTPAVVQSGVILIPAMVNKKGPYLFGLDTGLVYTLVSPDVCTATFGKSGNDTVNLHGVSSDIVSVMSKTEGVNTEFSDVFGPNGKPLKLYEPGKNPIFAFAGNQFSGEVTICFDFAQKNRADQFKTAGMFGFYLISHFTLDVDFQNSRVRMLFDQNRRYASANTYKYGTVAPR